MTPHPVSPLRYKIEEWGRFLRRPVAHLLVPSIPEALPTDDKPSHRAGIPCGAGIVFPESRNQTGGRRRALPEVLRRKVSRLSGSAPGDTGIRGEETLPERTA